MGSLDQVGDFIEVMITQRRLDGLIRYVDCHLAWVTHHVLLSAIALTADMPKGTGITVPRRFASDARGGSTGHPDHASAKS
jgi:hypothetical protein